jgi:putative spermidine/putrescine transport system ATP-binding protein
VYQQPASEFVADFIGSTNLIPGVVRAYDRDSQEAEVSIHNNAIFRVFHDRSLAPGQAVKILCKPEQLRVGAEGALSGQLSAVAYLGSVIQYQVELADCSLEVVAPADRAPLASVGADIHLSIQPEQLRLIEA